MVKLGRLQKVDLRDVWLKEDTDFTPWLAKSENIQLLGEAIGIDLIVEAEEKMVGPFRADILCKDEATNNWVLIENQLEKTDHRHLGQLLTYATGLDAVTIIWVASEFNEEHRATLDWLNKITDQQYNFFGVKIELYKIGESEIAPDFKIVSKPNNWSRSISSAASKIDKEDLGETKIKQLEFWTSLCNKISNKEQTPLKIRKARPQHWHTFPVGKTGVGLASTFNTNEKRVSAQLYISNDQQLYETLEKDMIEIEKDIGQKLIWQPLPGRSASRISLRKNECEIDTKNEWSEYQDWIIENLEKFYHVFNKRLQDID